MQVAAGPAADRAHAVAANPGYDRTPATASTQPYTPVVPGNGSTLL